MNSLLWFAVIILWVIGIIGVILIINISKRDKKTKNIFLAFDANGLEVTKQIFDLYIDENHKKWAVAKSYGPITIHDYSEIESFEINESGVSYDGMSIGSVGSHIGVSTTSMNKYISNLSVIIRLNNINYPMEIIALITSSVSTNSKIYLSTTLMAQQIISILTLMKKETA